MDHRFATAVPAEERVELVVLEGREVARAEPDRTGGQVHALADRPGFDEQIAVAPVAVPGGGLLQSTHHEKAHGSRASALLAQAGPGHGLAQVAPAHRHEAVGLRLVAVEAAVESLHGADGVLLDDVVAGLYGLACMAVLRLTLLEPRYWELAADGGGGL